MPELPEVETIVRELRREITGKRINHCLVPRASYLRGQEAGFFIDAVTGKSIKSIYRRGKYMIWRFDEGGGVLSHLGMTGKYAKIKPEEDSPKHMAARFGFDGFDLILDDARRFGRLLYFIEESEVKPLQAMGMEPFSEAFKAEYILKQFQSRKRAVKELLLDQSLIAGLGNIYASEILFRAGIHPMKAGNAVTMQDANRLIFHTRKVLEAAITHNGTTISDYQQVDGKPGNFQDLLLVYGREGDACPKCGSLIKRLVSGGRSSYYCEKCQK